MKKSKKRMPPGVREMTEAECIERDVAAFARQPGVTVIRLDDSKRYAIWLGRYQRWVKRLLFSDCGVKIELTPHQSYAAKCELASVVRWIAAALETTGMSAKMVEHDGSKPSAEEALDEMQRNEGL